MPEKRKQESRPVVVSVTVGGVELGFARPTPKDWDQYLDKLARGDDLPARRGLVSACCVTHDMAELKELLRRKPAAWKALAEGIDEASGGDVEPTIDDEERVVAVLPNGAVATFNCPEIDAWEELQHKLDVRKNKVVRFGEVVRGALAKLDADGASLAALNDYPAAMGPILASITEVAGGGLEVIVKKG